MKHLNFIVSLLVLFQVSLVSCKQEGLSEPEMKSEEQLEDIKVENGYLSFKDDSVFKAALNRILKSDQNELDRWEEGLAGFVSYRKTFNSIESKFGELQNSRDLEKFKMAYESVVSFNPDTSISYKFGTPLLAAISNNNGEFRVGQREYLITQEGRLISYPTSIKQKVSNIRDYAVSDSALDIQVRSYNMQSTGKGATISSDLWSSSNGMVKQELRVNNSNNRRLYIEIWRECIPSSNKMSLDYFNYYVRLLQQSKKIWGWDANNTDYYITNASLRVQYINEYWGIPTIWNLQTVPKLNNYFTPADFVKNDTKGHQMIGLYSGYNYGSFIDFSALIYTGGVPNNNVRFGYWNIVGN